MIGIVAEFNPYHEGHKYLINQARLQLGDEPIVVCMSGDYVQRGEPAIRNKFERASNTDADLVIELPLPWSLSSAEGFARGAVGLLREFGCKYLAFGTECGNIEELLKIKYDNSEITNYLKSNPELTWPAARSAVIGNDILSFPNNILAYEYLKFIGNMIPFTIKRTNIHDGPNSAKCIRETMVGPKLDDAIVTRLKMFEKSYYSQLPDSDNGIGNRLYDAVGMYNNLDDIIKNTKTKSVTESRIRRLVLCAALGVQKDMNNGIPPYFRVLYANSTGTELLKKESTIPILIKPSKINTLDDVSKRVFALGASAHDFYEYGFKEQNTISRGSDYRTGPIIVNNAQ